MIIYDKLFSVSDPESFCMENKCSTFEKTQDICFSILQFHLSEIISILELIQTKLPYTHNTGYF